MNSKFQKVVPFLLIVIMAVVSAVGVWTLVADAVYADPAALPEGEGVYIPDPDYEELWWSDNTFNTSFDQTLDITSPDGVVTATSFDLGINTIEIISYAGGTYYLTLHPQFFGPVWPPYDDQKYAQYAMQIQGLLVLNPSTGNYEDFFFGGFPKFPASYLLRNPGGAYYAQCKITSSIENVRSGDIISADWDGEDAYLKIPPEIYPTTQD